MGDADTVTVKMFGLLHSWRKSRGKPSNAVIHVPAEGLRAAEIARMLELPLDKIEGVFHEHKIRGLDLVVQPGAAIAFVPQGTPGPHRFTLGLYHAGKQ